MRQYVKIVISNTSPEIVIIYSYLSFVQFYYPDCDPIGSKLVATVYKSRYIVLQYNCYVCICDGIDNLSNTTGHPLRVVVVVGGGGFKVERPKREARGFCACDRVVWQMKDGAGGSEVVVQVDWCMGAWR